MSARKRSSHSDANLKIIINYIKAIFHYTARLTSKRERDYTEARLEFYDQFCILTNYGTNLELCVAARCVQAFDASSFKFDLGQSNSSQETFHHRQEGLQNEIRGWGPNPHLTNYFPYEVRNGDIR